LSHPIIIQGALNKKKSKEEKIEAFLSKITSLSIPGKGLIDIVSIVYKVSHQYLNVRS